MLDDNSLIGPEASLVDAQAEQLADLIETLGVSFKRLKSRRAATLQLVLGGFWWDSVGRTRTLETTKLAIYLDHLREARDAKYLTLHDLQVLSGRARLLSSNGSSQSWSNYGRFRTIYVLWRYCLLHHAGLRVGHL